METQSVITAIVAAAASVIVPAVLASLWRGLGYLKTIAQLLNGLPEVVGTQQEHGERLDKHDVILDDHGKRIVRLETSCGEPPK